MKKAEWGCLGLLGLLIVAFVYPVLIHDHVSRQFDCLSNLKQIALGMLMHAEDWDGPLPDAARWRVLLSPYTGNTQLYDCPSGYPNTRPSYAMNPRLSGKKVTDFLKPAEVIAFYDADDAGRPVARHNGSTNCAFLDTHGRWVRGVPAIP